MFKALLGMLSADRKPTLVEKPRVYIEYTQGRWAVLIRNPGQQKWTYLLDTRKRINLYNNFGDPLGTKIAYQGFNTHDEATQWVKDNIPEAVYEKKKLTMGEVYDNALSAPVA